MSRTTLTPGIDTEPTPKPPAAPGASTESSSATPDHSVLALLAATRHPDAAAPSGPHDRRRRDVRRERLFDVVSSRPGLTVKELAQAIGLTRTSTMHHAKILAGAGRIRQVRHGTRVLHFAAGTGPEAVSPLLMLHGKNARVLLHELRAAPDARPEALAARLQVTVRSIRRHLRSLIIQGLVRMHRGPEPPRRWVELRPDVRDALGASPSMESPPPTPRNADAPLSR